ncbi:transposase [Avibacterium sp. 21-595]|uniref:transposase n=1 Tax=Avibacterium sp. 21-595 TaxID=2911527 RepID=UPI003FA38B7C
MYLDESGFKISDYRPYAYAHKSQRCYDIYHWQAKNQPHAIGAIHNNQWFAVGLYECSINSDVFLSWVEKVLLPKLPKNSVIVMDNATFHKRQDIQDTITTKGHDILWLPPYSPDLNPIEQV